MRRERGLNPRALELLRGYIRGGGSREREREREAIKASSLYSAVFLYGGDLVFIGIWA